MTRFIFFSAAHHTSFPPPPPPPKFRSFELGASVTNDCNPAFPPEALAFKAALLKMRGGEMSLKSRSGVVATAQIDR